MFVIAFNTDNDAFAEDDVGEIADKLSDVKRSLLEYGKTGGAVYDRNGNRIGLWSYEAE